MADNSVVLTVAMIAFAGTLIAASIGFAGGLIIQLVLDRRKQVSEKRRKKAEKLEELVSLLHEHLRWMALYEEENRYAMFPLHAKLEAITSVYFIEFNDRVDVIKTLALAYDMARKNKSENYEPVEEDFMQAHFDFLEEVRRYAKREFQ